VALELTACGSSVKNLRRSQTFFDVSSANTQGIQPVAVEVNKDAVDVVQTIERAHVQLTERTLDVPCVMAIIVPLFGLPCE
jgi:hypothetical protein